MIAKNFMKYPEALRFQRELFSNGYHNQPRIMRLMECVFDWTQTAPDWWKSWKASARALAKRVKQSIADFFKDKPVKQLTLNLEGNANKHATTIDGLSLMTPTLSVRLRSAGVKTLDELAELAPEELQAITKQPEYDACELLKAARQHWFH